MQCSRSLSVSVEGGGQNTDYKNILYSALEELRRMSKMVDDMLFLAKADNGKITPSAEGTSMAEITTSVIEYYELAAEDKKVEAEASKAKSGISSWFGGGGK